MVPEDLDTGEAVEDEFLDDVPPTPVYDRVCAFCRQGHAHGASLVRRIEDGVKEKDARDPRRIWLDERPLRVTKNSSCYVHRLCALYSPRTLNPLGKWANVAGEVRRSRLLSCSLCRERGGHIGCNVPSCPIRMHLHCALADGFKPSTHHVTTVQFLCKRHRQMDEQDEKQLDREDSMIWDLAKGHEPEEIMIKDRDLRKIYARHFHPGFKEGSPGGFKVKELNLGSSFVSSAWTYVSKSVDSDQANFDRTADRQRHVCCSCEGDCSDDCPCRNRSGGVGYTKGGLLNVSVCVPYIYECNALCRCNASRCKNRTSQNGIQRKVSLRKAPYKQSAVALPRPLAVQTPGRRSLKQMSPNKRKRKLESSVVYVKTKSRPETNVPVYDLTVADPDTDDEEEIIIVDDEEERKVRTRGQQNFTAIVVAEEHIPKGSFICEYAGQLFPIQERPEESETVFHIVPPTGVHKAQFALDSSRYSNLGRFIRRLEAGELRGGRQCKPNVVEQYILGPTNQNIHTPVVALFALRNIYAGDELLRQPPDEKR